VDHLESSCSGGVLAGSVWAYPPFWIGLTVGPLAWVGGLLPHVVTAHAVLGRY